MKADGSRVCIVSLRAISRQVAWFSNYEFEDLVATVDEATLIEVKPGPSFKQVDWFVQRLMWRPGFKHVARHLNPGLISADLDRDYDLLVFVCMNVFDLLYLNALPRWRERCKTAVCVVIEFYAEYAKDHEFHLGLLRQFDHVFLGFAGSVDAAQRTIGRPCHHLPVAVDALRFTPLPNPPRRSIDVYSMGRRAPWAHEALLREAKKSGIFYVYDTVSSALVKPKDHNEHRDLVANLAKRSHYFVTFPAKVGNDGETRGQSEVGTRFFEGAAAGTVMIGEAPGSPSFKRDFGWPDAVLPLHDEETLANYLERIRKEPELLSTVSKRNAIEALRRHDWAYRWREILEIAKLEPMPKLLDRERQLAELASFGADLKSW